MDNDRQENGFTLIELLVTVAIIGLLAAIAIPEFNHYKESAYDAVARSALKNSLMSIEMYINENNVVGAEGCSTDGTTPCSTKLEGYGYAEDPNVVCAFEIRSLAFSGACGHRKSESRPFGYAGQNMIVDSERGFGRCSDACGPSGCDHSDVSDCII